MLPSIYIPILSQLSRFTHVFMLNRNSTVSHMTLVKDLRYSQRHTCILKDNIINHFNE